MDALLKQYIEMFDENFPITFIRGKTDNEIKEILQECIENNEPYKIEYPDDNADY